MRHVLTVVCHGYSERLAHAEDNGRQCVLVARNEEEYGILRILRVRVLRVQNRGLVPATNVSTFTIIELV